MTQTHIPVLAGELVDLLDPQSLLVRAEQLDDSISNGSELCS